MISRPMQSNCRNEPHYPDHEVVVFVLSAPEITIHLQTVGCRKDYPHPFVECGLVTP